MKRSDFIKTSSIFVAGSIIKPLTSNSFLRDNDLESYLIPTLLNNEIKNLHHTYKIAATNTSKSTELVEKSIKIIINNYPEHPYAKKYKSHQEKIVQKRKNTASLNGEGLYYVNTAMKDRMNEDKVKASTATHLVCELKELDKKALENYCDKHEKQTCDEDDRVYIFSLEDNPNNDTYYIPQVLDYIVYNPTYYCIGLPVEDPQKHFINETFARDIINKNKTYKTINQLYYYTQKFKFRGNQCNKNMAPKETIIYWNYDMAVHEYFDLSPIKPCGDPSIECQVLSGSTRPTISRP